LSFPIDVLTTKLLTAKKGADGSRESAFAIMSAVVSDKGVLGVYKGEFSFDDFRFALLNCYYSTEIGSLLQRRKVGVELRLFLCSQVSVLAQKMCKSMRIGGNVI
jgi:hypothetical protein